jgi:2',3'-cyclic-nucleotide 2'-phosphodiesterase (5'-nucleotidase family)
MAELAIFHTTDMHNRLRAPQAHVLAGMKEQAGAVLLLDAGDAVGAGNLTYRPRGEPILQLMSQAGYDAMAMGNRESHPTFAVLKRKLADARFPVLAANMRPQRGKPLPPSVRSHLMRTVAGGVRVGIIGLAPQITSPRSWWSRVTDYVFDEPEKTAAGLVKKLRPQVDLIVLLAHVGGEAAARLAAIEGVDLVIAGHDHKTIMPPLKVGAAYVAQSPPYARAAGRLDIRLTEGGVSVEGQLVEL